MRTIPYSKDMQIVNTDQLPRGVGAKYLMAYTDHLGRYIAHSWKRKIPKTIPPGHVLIEF